MKAGWLVALMQVAGIRDPAESRLLHRARLFRRRLQGYDSQIRDAYLSTTHEPKLHIGGGWRLIDGWLNTDIALVPGVMYMDATRQFPLKDATFRYVFTEHMVEHIAYEQFGAMLKECHRVMCNGGIIRVTTPDMNAVVGLLANPRSPVQERYMAFFNKHFAPKTHPDTPAAIVNTFFKSWGHTFIYDRETLEVALRAAGFCAIERCRTGESNHVSLRKLEHEERYPDGLLDYESIVLEASK
jgi:predicted SAM-dependent methyltransferase